MIRNLLSGSSEAVSIPCSGSASVLDIFSDGSCKALYRFDGNANDESGTYHGNENAITYGGGSYGRGAVFNGSSSYVSCNTAYYPQYSVSFWIKPNSVTTLQVFMCESDSSGTNISTIYSFGLSANGSYRIYFGTGTSTIAPVTDGTVPSGMSVGVWYHLSLVIDGTSVKIYKNGALSYNGTSQSALPQVSVNGRFAIGRAGLYNGQYFNGSMDQVRFFNKAITAQEAVILANECAPASILDDINPFEDGSLKALYQFNDDANDSTGIYNGTATGAIYSTGKFGKAISLPTLGTSQVLLPIPYTDFVGTNVSVSIWVNMQSLVTQSTAGSHAFVVCDGGWAIAVYSTGISFTVWNGSTAYNATNAVVPKLNTWYHLVAVKDTVNGMKLYINGVLSGTNALTGAMNPQTYTSVGFGAYNQFANRKGFTGKIDQARIFNKALNPIEVTALYTETSPIKESILSLPDPLKDFSGKALYRFDGNLNDESGNYNGSGTGITYGIGQYGRCAVFNSASASRVVLSPTLGTIPVSYSMMVKTATKTGTGTLVARMYTGCYFASVTNGKLSMWAADSATLTAPTDSISDGLWHHVVLIFEATKMSMYVDGILEGQVSGVAYGNRTYLNNITIGNGYSGSWAAPLTGSIDQFRVFNKALTQSQVTRLFSGELDVL